MMTGWRTWTGVAIGIAGSAAAAFGVELTQAQIDAIQMLSVSFIGVGIGSKVDRNRVATAVVAQKTEAVVQQVAKVEKNAKVEKKVDAPPSIFNRK